MLIILKFENSADEYTPVIVDNEMCLEVRTLKLPISTHQFSHKQQCLFYGSQT